jgi:hypothetical protein
MLATLVAGCAKVQARTEPVLPELVPPPPPTRMVETYVEEPLQTVTPSPADTALSQPPVRTTTKPAAQRADAVKPEPIRTEPEPEPERPASPPPSLTLQPAPGSESKTESSIRALLLQAGRDLGRVNYASLSTDGKAQYDMARRLMEQSEEAQRKGNLVFAGKLADKAATMAAVLVR